MAEIDEVSVGEITPAAEIEENPNRIDEDHRNGIVEFVAEGAGSGDFGAMVEFMFDNWLVIVDRDQMVAGSTARRLRVLKAERDRQDTERQALDDEIAELEKGDRRAR